MNSQLTQAFNKNLDNFMIHIENYFKDDLDIKTAINSINAVKKLNPKLLIRVWKYNVINPYRKELLEGNLNYFINKDYSNDLGFNNNEDILKKIDEIRNKLHKLDESNKKITLNYLLNFIKICDLINI